VLLKEIGADPPALFEIRLLLIKPEAIQLKEGEQQRAASPHLQPKRSFIILSRCPNRQVLFLDLLFILNKLWSLTYRRLLLNCCHVPDLIPGARADIVAPKAKCLRVCFTIINRAVPENFQKLPTKNLAHVCTLSF
jgi:hypothetical protein